MTSRDMGRRPKERVCLCVQTEVNCFQERTTIVDDTVINTCSFFFNQ